MQFQNTLTHTKKTRHQALPPQRKQVKNVNKNIDNKEPKNYDNVAFFCFSVILLPFLIIS